jgi:hypothetical protein
VEVSGHHDTNIIIIIINHLDMNMEENKTPLLATLVKKKNNGRTCNIGPGVISVHPNNYIIVKL